MTSPKEEINKRSLRGKPNHLAFRAKRETEEVLPQEAGKAPARVTA